MFKLSGASWCTLLTCSLSCQAKAVESGGVTGTGREQNTRCTGSLTSCPNISSFGVQSSRGCFHVSQIDRRGQKRQ